MRSPIVAMLWENWRLTRFEVIARLVVSLVAGALVVTVAVSDEADAAEIAGTAVLAIVVGVSFHGTLWFTIARLNGGRFMDGYRPGFPLHLLYTRPVRTAALVGVAMAYAAAMGAALYLVWALSLRAAFGFSLPLLPVAAWIGALHTAQAAAYWSTRSRLVQWVGSIAAFVVCSILALWRVGGGDPAAPRIAPDQWSHVFDYSLVDYGMAAAVGLISFGLAVGGVARQRRGDARAALPRTAGSGTQDWLADLVRFPCPTSSATRAQLWFELKSGGLMLLAIGTLFALAMPLTFAAGAYADFFRSAALGVPLMAALVLLAAGGNAFGIRRKQGHAYASVFDATQASRTGPMAGLKVLTRSACVAAALGMLGWSVWLSMPLMSRWPEAARQTVQFERMREGLAAAFASLSGMELAALLVIAFGSVTLLVAARAILEAVFTRYRRRTVIVGAVLLLYPLTLILLDLAGSGSRWDAFVNAIFGATVWIVPAGIVSGTVYLFWRILAERLMTPVQTGGVVLISAVFAAAWMTLLGANGVNLGDMSAARALWATWPIVVSPLLASALAAWSLSRVRHG